MTQVDLRVQSDCITVPAVSTIPSDGMIPAACINSASRDEVFPSLSLRPRWIIDTGYKYEKRKKNSDNYSMK